MYATIIGLKSKTANIAIYQELDASDRILVRYLEDMIDILLTKGVLEKRDVPEIVRSRIRERRKLRLKLLE